MLLPALLLIAAGILASLWAAWRLQPRDDGAHDLPHGDVPHIPFGATPRSLINHEGE